MEFTLPSRTVRIAKIWLITKKIQESKGRRKVLPRVTYTSIGVAAGSVISLLALIGTMYPTQTSASVISDILSRLRGQAEASVSPDYTESVGTMPLPKPAMNINPSSIKGGGDIVIVDEAALLPEEGPSGTMADIEKSKNTTISRYVVREGDTLTGIAALFEVSANTIKWANDIPPSGTIRVGQTLTILPVTGVKYTVKSGDTIESIAKRFDGDATEIVNFNGIDGALAAGTELIIPNGEIAAPPAAPAKAKSGTPSKSYAGYYIRPINGVRTQGVHGYNGVDLAAPVGTPIVASAAGEVLIAREGGWNGGYGSYVVIRHGNGTQTLYAHASSVMVGVGQTVQQGQVIAYSGNSGKSTGPHLHFEIRGGPRNPF